MSRTAVAPAASRAVAKAMPRGSPLLEAAVLLERVERPDLGEGGEQQRPRLLLDRTVAGAARAGLRPQPSGARGCPSRTRPRNRRGSSCRCSPRGWDRLAPAVDMHGDMQRLRGVAVVVAPDADVAQGELLAQPAVGLEPGALLGRGRRLGALDGGAPIGEVLADLLPAVEDGIGQVARLVLVEALGAQQRVVLRGGSAAACRAAARPCTDPSSARAIEWPGSRSASCVRPAPFERSSSRPMTAISAAASGERTKAGRLSGSFSMATPLTISWPVAPHAQLSRPAPAASASASRTVAPCSNHAVPPSFVRGRFPLSDRAGRPNETPVTFRRCSLAAADPPVRGGCYQGCRCPSGASSVARTAATRSWTGAAESSRSTGAFCDASHWSCAIRLRCSGPAESVGMRPLEKGRAGRRHVASRVDPRAVALSLAPPQPLPRSAGSMRTNTTRS